MGINECFGNRRRNVPFNAIRVKFKNEIEILLHTLLNILENAVKLETLPSFHLYEHLLEEKSSRYLICALCNVQYKMTGLRMKVCLAVQRSCFIIGIVTLGATSTFCHVL